MIAAEEIGFYRGHSYEKNVVERSYFGLVKHINRVLKVRIWHGVVEEGIVKWVCCFVYPSYREDQPLIFENDTALGQFRCTLLSDEIGRRR